MDVEGVVKEEDCPVVAEEEEDVVADDQMSGEEEEVERVVGEVGELPSLRRWRDYAVQMSM